MIQPNWALVTLPVEQSRDTRFGRRRAPAPWPHGMRHWPTMRLPGRR
jgi:hypothetical protein